MIYELPIELVCLSNNFDLVPYNLRDSSILLYSCVSTVAFSSNVCSFFDKVRGFDSSIFSIGSKGKDF